MTWPETGSTKVNSYAGYSVGCAIVWAAILAAGQRRLDAETRKSLQLGCAGWWSGWTSATIARVGYPPPKKLTPQASKRLGVVSLALVTVGLLSIIRLLIAGKRPA